MVVSRMRPLMRNIGFYTMKDIMINIVQTNMEMVEQDDGDDRTITDYESKDCYTW